MIKVDDMCFIKKHKKHKKIYVSYVSYVSQEF